ncbi:MAG: helix-turn-helix transcriptional regulator [Lachnospiraceae bacterium]|nr:helix-turn-helix transcriptional regulator [Lachnospiraceae bacterium]MBQ7781026.1 helix-turn-helix transcriptional regulator [Lachnospiraceae bacterium]
MENKKIGQFIAELRKEKQMTQKELAEKLYITDKAVSKWERGLSCPDISLISPLADILGITASELLNGEKSSVISKDMNDSVDNALEYAQKATTGKLKSIHNVFAAGYTALLLIGVVVCTVCNLAISGCFTWSLYPISAIVFAWFVFFPVIRYGAKGIWGSLIALTVLIIPFLHVLAALIKGDNLIRPIGVRVTVVSLIFLWSVFVIFKVLHKKKLLAATITCLLAIVLCIVINCTLSVMLKEPVSDVWDILAYVVLLMLAVGFFVQHCRCERG